MNITNFTFNHSPFTKIKRYEIHTLSEEGIKNYTRKDSYVHRYLRSLDHQRIDELFDHRRILGVTEEGCKNFENKLETNEASNTSSLKFHKLDDTGGKM